jgi:hypothetical protein
LIDPETGQTRDELDTGAGGASLRIGTGSEVRFGPMSESSFLDNCAIAMRQTLGKLGLKVFCAAMFAGVGFGLSLALVSYSGGGSAFTSGGLAGGATAMAGAAAVGGC